MKRKHDDITSIKAVSTSSPKAIPIINASTSSRKCPFLSTVDRKMLNFDFEKACSVTLSHQNVYACLVCGRYFGGKGPGSAAYTHSVHDSHFVFLQLSSGAVFCLPDDYEICDSSLEDIQYNLAPQFPNVAMVDANSARTCRDVFGHEYVPGFAPMNALAHNFANATVAALARVEPLRDFFLQPNNYKDCEKGAAVVRLFGELVRKLWNARKIKAAVSAHEFVQAVSTASGRRFALHEQADAAEFCKFVLHELHIGLGGSRKRDTIVTLCFQGQVEVCTQEIPTIIKESEGSSSITSSMTTNIVPAMIFALELPTSPLFKDSREQKSLVPVIEISEALTKYDGSREFDTVNNTVIKRRTFRILRLPPYVIFHVNRFSKTGWRLEKNHTIVNATIQGLELNNLIEKPVVDDKKKKKTKQMVPGSWHAPVKDDVYDLVANICHKTLADVEQKAKSQNAIQDGHYVANLYNEPQQQWYEVEDLHVKKTLPQLVACSEAYLMIYKARRNT